MTNLEGPFSSTNSNLGEKGPHAGGSSVPSEVREQPHIEGETVHDIAHLDPDQVIERTPDTMTYTEEERALARAKQAEITTPPQVSEVQRKKGFWTRGKVAVAAGVTLIGGAVGGAIALGGGDDTPKKENSPEQAAGPDGEPIRYVEYGGSNTDRNNDGADDGFTDVNENGKSDDFDFWDSEEKKFVSAQEVSGETGLEGATPQDLEDIANLQTIIGESTSMPEWQKDYIHLDPLVKRRIMLEFNKRAEYDSDEAWRGAIIFQFSRTPEDIRGE